MNNKIKSDKSLSHLNKTIEIIKSFNDDIKQSINNNDISFNNKIQNDLLKNINYDDIQELYHNSELNDLLDNFIKLSELSELTEKDNKTSIRIYDYFIALYTKIFMPDGYQSMNGLDKGVDKTKEIQLSYNILKKMLDMTYIYNKNINTEDYFSYNDIFMSPYYIEILDKALSNHVIFQEKYYNYTSTNLKDKEAFVDDVLLRYLKIRVCKNPSNPFFKQNFLNNLTNKGFFNNLELLKLYVNQTNVFENNDISSSFLISNYIKFEVKKKQISNIYYDNLIGDYLEKNENKSIAFITPANNLIYQLDKTGKNFFKEQPITHSHNSLTIGEVFSNYENNNLDKLKNINLKLQNGLENEYNLSLYDIYHIYNLDQNIFLYDNDNLNLDINFEEYNKLYINHLINENESDFFIHFFNKIIKNDDYNFNPNSLPKLLNDYLFKIKFHSLSNEDKENILNFISNLDLNKNYDFMNLYLNSKDFNLSFKSMHWHDYENIKFNLDKLLNQKFNLDKLLNHFNDLSENKYFSNQIYLFLKQNNILEFYQNKKMFAFREILIENNDYPLYDSFSYAIKIKNLKIINSLLGSDEKIIKNLKKDLDEYKHNPYSNQKEFVIFSIINYIKTYQSNEFDEFKENLKNAVKKIMIEFKIEPYDIKNYIDNKYNLITLKNKNTTENLNSLDEIKLGLDNLLNINKKNKIKL